MKALLIGYMLIGLGAFVGWVLNIMAIVHGIDAGLTTKMIIRIVGLFVAPLGAVMGYL